MPSPSAIPVVCALIERDGLILMAQRPPHKHLGLKWEFPGGKIEPGESAETALHRELREELACTVEILHALPRTTHAYETITIEMIPFVARLAAGSTEPVSHEHVALRWIEPATLSTLDLPAADTPIIAAYHALRTHGISNRTAAIKEVGPPGPTRVDFPKHQS